MSAIDEPAPWDPPAPAPEPPEHSEFWECRRIEAWITRWDAIFTALAALDMGISDTNSQ